jgi:hypothetical protein
MVSFAMLAIAPSALAQVPQTPTGCSATPVAGGLKLQWNPANGATSYDVSRDGTSIYSGSATDFVDHIDIAAANDYCVTASNSHGTSEACCFSGCFGFNVEATSTAGGEVLRPGRRP